MKTKATYSNCNVCGRTLIRDDELAIGACAICANEKIEPPPARKDLEQELQRLRSDISTTESALGISGIYAKLEQERDQLRLELEAAKCAPPKAFLSAPDSTIMKCGHNSYWKTHYENCMACRAGKAEKERDQLQREVKVAWAERDASESAYRKSEQERESLQRSNAELAAQVARLREVSIGVVTHKTSSLSKPIEKHLSALEVALSLTPSDALKPILEFVKDVLDKAGDGKSTTVLHLGQMNQARAILKQYGQP